MRSLGRLFNDTLKIEQPFVLRNAIVRACLVVAVLGAAVGLDAFRPAANYSIGDLAFDSSVGRPFEVQTPVNLPESFNLQFDALVSSPTTEKRSIVQGLGSSSSTIHFELQPPHKLVLILFGIDSVPIPLVDALSLDRWHHFAAIGRQGGVFDVAVDGVVRHFNLASVHQIQSSALIGTTDFTFRFARIGVGVKAPDSQPMIGKIRNLSLSSRYIVTLPWPLLLVVGLFVVLVTGWLLWPWVGRISAAAVTDADLVVLSVFGAASVVGYALYAIHAPLGKWAVLLAMGLGALGGVLASRRFQIVFPRLVKSAALPLVSLLSIGSLVMLPDWTAAMRMFERWPLSSSCCLVLATSAAIVLVGLFAQKEPQSRWSRWLPLLPYLVFAVLATRTDSVFSPINALHWDYVLGPIRAIREGGWLLWDVPSQYGFLSVLIPAVLPIHPVVNAFYWFQAALLLIAAATLYRTLYTTLGLHWVASCAIVVAFFFFADPLMIGPAPYPSMSAVRFLWCYILLAVAAANFLGPRPSVDRFARFATPIWIVGLLWSAEGAIYASVIFFTPLLLSLCWRRDSPDSVRNSSAIKLLGLPIVLALAVFGAVDAVYLLCIGRDADWSMFVMYALSYGNGYGEEPLLFYGPVVLIGLVLAVGAVGFARTVGGKYRGSAYAIATAFAVVWIVSTYYFGRAFSITLTMLLPFVVFSLLITVRALDVRARSIQAAVAIPLIALGFFAAFWNANAPATLPEIVATSKDACSRLPVADPELALLLGQTGVSRSTSVVYYDSWIAMPRSIDGPYDRNWLPTPIQALEEPIPVAERDKIISRFIEQRRLQGYFVQVLGGYNAPADAEAWISFLSKFYRVAVVGRSEHYRVLKFSLRYRPLQSAYPGGDAL